MENLIAQPFLQELLDIVFKSSMIFMLTLVVASLFRSKISNANSHLLWMNSLLCMALLPFVGSWLGWLSIGFLDVGSVTFINVQPNMATEIEAAGISLNSIFIATYVLVTVGLLARLLLAALKLGRLRDSSIVPVDSRFSEQLSTVASRLDISRNITIKLSSKIASPMSFGLISPIILLPTDASNWNESTLEDVLVHEASHIARLDWLTMLFSHLLTSVFWFNPLVWLARAQINEAAEQTCDSAIISYGKDGVYYAEELLRLAKNSRRNMQTPVLAQLMFDESSLSLRIKNILDGSSAGRASRLFGGVLLLSATLIVSACSGVDLFGNDESDQEVVPTLTAIPQYPSQAAEQGIEGWVLVGFTITEAGKVAKNSIVVVDAEPADIFDRNSINAASRFEFEPRIRNGKAVEIEGVQYVFRYELEDDSDALNTSRQPPEARSRGL
ncbi:MAG: hypothetical protein COA96_12065 [SAR86 cluster bacterium]|uniref:Protein TonB n=1 Tax=SAR86 cluster bacterium TaxID=2030880 RepID=A0A2A5AW06_9GAMM|nr:MAG: hypothetical protein COA96_12065 [SAR86 cluster bacterium]